MDGDVREKDIHDIVLAASWTRIVIRGAYSWTDEKHSIAIQAMSAEEFHPRGRSTIFDLWSGIWCRCPCQDDNDGRNGDGQLCGHIMITGDIEPLK